MPAANARVIRAVDLVHALFLAMHGECLLHPLRRADRHAHRNERDPRVGPRIAATVQVAPRRMAKPMRPAQTAAIRKATLASIRFMAFPFARCPIGTIGPNTRDAQTDTARGSLDCACYMWSIIVSGFLSLTMSAIVRTTVALLSFFHQCLVPLNSRAMSPALCRIGTVHLLLYS